MSKYIFGVGVLNAKQRRDNRGRLIAELDREYVGIDSVKGINYEISTELKSLSISKGFPVATAIGAKTITGTLDLAGDDIYFRALVEGQKVKVGANGMHFRYADYVIPETGVINLVIDDEGTFTGVVNVLEVATAKKMVKVASNPAVGQFSVSTLGVFTFNVADADKEIQFAYTYKTEKGKQLIVKNYEMGAGAEFVLELFFPKNGKFVKFSNVVFGKMSFKHTADGFGEYSVDFLCSADELDDVYEINDLNGD